MDKKNLLIIALSVISIVLLIALIWVISQDPGSVSSTGGDVIVQLG